MLNFKETAIYKRLFSAFAPIFIAGTTYNYDKIRKEIQTKFDTLESATSLTFPLLPKSELRHYFAKSQLGFLARMDLLNPGRYPKVNIYSNRGNYVVLPNIHVDGYTLGERVVNFKVFCWFAVVASTLKSENTVAPVLTHGFRSDGYQLLLRAYFASRRNIYRQLFNAAPSNNSTHSIENHAVDITFPGYLENPYAMTGYAPYWVLQSNSLVQVPYSHEPWHITGAENEFSRIDPFGIVGSPVANKRLIDSSVIMYKETFGNQGEIRVVY